MPITITQADVDALGPALEKALTDAGGNLVLAFRSLKSDNPEMLDVLVALVALELETMGQKPQ